MDQEGGCYCGALRYRLTADPMMKAQCHCRECQYISGGGVNHTMVVPETGFAYQKGEPRGFARSDLERPVTREFCENCGTHILARAEQLAGVVMLKVGTLDDPAAAYGGPEVAIFLCDEQPFHHRPDGMPAFQKGPGSEPA